MKTMKQAAALTLAGMMFASPMTASAATWAEVVTAIKTAQSSGSAAKAGDDVTVSYDGETTTISGGEITGYDSDGDSEEYGGVYNGYRYYVIFADDAKHALTGGRYVLESTVLAGDDGSIAVGSGFTVVINGEVKSDIDLYGKGTGTTDVTIGEKAEVGFIYLYDCAGQSTVKLTALSNVDGISVYAYDESTASVSVNGNVNKIWLCPVSADGKTEILGSGALKDGQIIIDGIGYFGEDLEAYASKSLHLDADLFGKQPGEIVEIQVMIGWDENGDLLYETIKIVLEDLTPEEPFNLYETEAYKEAMEEHAKEEERKAGAIGGVYGSPYWVKQLNLGYNSYNLRLTVDGEAVNFKESLSWRETGKNSSKALGLRVNTKGEALSTLRMQLDEAVLEVLERTEISLITLSGKDGEPVMSYEVSDIRAAYEQYGLDGSDVLVLGGYDDEVMMIGSDGVMKPVEEAAK